MLVPMDFLCSLPFRTVVSKLFSHTELLLGNYLTNLFYCSRYLKLDSESLALQIEDALTDLVKEYKTKFTFKIQTSAVSDVIER